jgi:hypothetical protein
MPPSPNSASSEMIVARCSDGIRELSQPRFTGVAMPKAAVETRYRGTAIQNCCTSAAPTIATVEIPVHTMRMRSRSETQPVGLPTKALPRIWVRPATTRYCFGSILTSRSDNRACQRT